MSDSFYFKSKAPAVVAIVSDYERRLSEMRQQAVGFGHLFGGAAAIMVDLSRHYVGGIKLNGVSDPNPHWKRADDHGYRQLRSKAIVPKGAPKVESKAIRIEHERLLQLWLQSYPARVDRLGPWDQLGVNNGSIMMCGGVMFEHNGTAYFNLGFAINQEEDLQKRAAGKPSYGWIDQAEEITATDYRAAGQAKYALAKEVQS
ncbi:hypothetical protein RPW65_07940 [Pseudomonas sp. NyZ704]|nr:hypothetical protein RPW65_07940 [Pseudomonas sp. NyZ704]